MGAGILPTAIHDKKLYFLFGKEGKYEDTAPGFSDFGGGTDHKETFLTTATREGSEESTGFLGDQKTIREMLLKHGTYNIDYKADGHDTYREHIFPFKYNEYLPYYYNNNQQFLQKHLSPKILKTSKIFEKAEIKWICVDELKKMRPKFRFWYQNIIDMILDEEKNIKHFIQKAQKAHKKSLKKKTKRTTTKNSKKV